MKKFLNFFVMAIILGSCSYDDDDVWNSIHNLSNRLDSLENKLNTDIRSIQTLLDTTKQIVSVTQTSNGQTVTFDDQTFINISYSENQLQTIGVKAIDDVYYWTINGEWLTDTEGQKMRVTGNDGSKGTTPQLKITDDYWYVSTDNGTSWTEAGKASGADGDSFFKKVVVEDDYITFTLSDGTSFNVAKSGTLGFTVPVSFVAIGFGETAEYTISTKNIADIAINKPEGWNVNINNNILTINAPNSLYAETSGQITMIAVGNNGLCIIRKIAVSIPYILSFEDLDASYLAGPTSYGANLYSSYSGDQYIAFYDKGSDLTMGINESYDSYDFWNGGIAISQWNDMETAGYANQCSVFYSGKDGNGGNNGSKTFAVSFGYSGGYMNTSNVSFLDENTERTFAYFYVNNATYSVLSMEGGDSFAKAFSYTDQDWFKLTVEGFDKNGTSTGTVEFYLADFRTPDAKGIVKEWTKVDLASLGNVHKLTFDLSSSDSGIYGMNTPGYFCFDDLAIKQ